VGDWAIRLDHSPLSMSHAVERQVWAQERAAAEEYEQGYCRRWTQGCEPAANAVERATGMASTRSADVLRGPGELTFGRDCKLALAVAAAEKDFAVVESATATGIGPGPGNWTATRRQGGVTDVQKTSFSVQSLRLLCWRSRIGRLRL